MKKVFCMVLCAVMVLSLVACGSNNTGKTENPTQAGQTQQQGQQLTSQVTAAPQGEKVSKDESGKAPMETFINADDYLLYQNIFYNKMGDQFEGKEFNKEGTFTSIYDAFKQTTRYYIWGYYDRTKCCDWQWEVKFDDTSNLPANGSYVSVKGKFTKSADALDGYWITSPSLTVKKSYSPFKVDYDMTCMDATLERVEIQNIQYKADQFEGKTVAIYGRIKSNSSVQHPYLDDAWQMEFSTNDKIPAIGTLVVVTGKIEKAGISDAKIAKTNLF